jgi:hypothetical protein
MPTHPAPARSIARSTAGFLLSLLALVPCHGRASNSNPALQGGPRHPVPVRPPGASAPLTATAHLVYYGGPVISNVEVVQVLWGEGPFQPFVRDPAPPSLASFYAAITRSAYMDWLAEYDTGIVAASGTAGTNQRIRRGTFLGTYTITPSSALGSGSIDDAQIQTELSRQLASGALPAPTRDADGRPNTVYMLHFPRGTTVTDGGSRSCVIGGFCAYHGTIARAGGDLFYTVLPDMSPGSGCDRGCGDDPDPFHDQTSIASHELVELATDPEVGLATSTLPPLAWYDVANGEIGDICNGQQGRIVGGDGLTYTVQLEWSNHAGACVVTGEAPPVNDFSISIAPATMAVAQKGLSSIAVWTASTSGTAEAVNLSVSGQPSGVTAAFEPPSVTAGETSRLELRASPAAELGTFAITVTGTSPSASRSASAEITVTLHPIAIVPDAVSLEPGGVQVFTASGGSEVGFTWSLTTNASGASIDAASGRYVAGATGEVVDVVEVMDSVGSTATAAVTVTRAPDPASSSTPRSGGCGTAVPGAPPAVLGALAVLALLRLGLSRRPRAARAGA